MTPLLPPEPDTPTINSADSFAWGVSSAVDLLNSFASKGEAERAALLMSDGLILGAWFRLGNLIELLSLRRAA